MYTLTTCTALVNVKVCINVPYAIILCTYAYNVHIYIYTHIIFLYVGQSEYLAKVHFQDTTIRGHGEYWQNQYPPLCFCDLFAYLLKGAARGHRTYTYSYAYICIRGPPFPPPSDVSSSPCRAAVLCSANSAQQRRVYGIPYVYTWRTYATRQVVSVHTRIYVYILYTYIYAYPCTYVYVHTTRLSFDM